jgi:hypothetical protein
MRSVEHYFLNTYHLAPSREPEPYYCLDEVMADSGENPSLWESFMVIHKIVFSHAANVHSVNESVSLRTSRRGGMLRDCESFCLAVSSSDGCNADPVGDCYPPICAASQI